MGIMVLYSMEAIGRRLGGDFSKIVHGKSGAVSHSKQSDSSYEGVLWKIELVAMDNYFTLYQF